jgi:glycine hydroxymethyltransferase
MLDELSKIDPDVFQLIRSEENRQYKKLRLIPSENYVSKAVMEATGSVFTNKYSEGYPRKRYYEGQQNIDVLEQLAIDRAKALFNSEHANVQPYSGTPANLAVYYALLEIGDKVMGMSLPHGGHLSHGWKVSFSGRFYNAVQYTVDKDTHLIDYDRVREMAGNERPKLIFAGATAYPRKFDFAAFSDIAKEVGAYLVADIAHISGLIIAEVHPSPVPYAHVVTTTTHKTLRGPRGAMILCRNEVAERIDRAIFPALQGGPHNHTTAAIAVALHEASKPEFKEYGKQIVKNAAALADELLSYGFKLITGGTDNHLILIDMTAKGVTGKQTSKALDKAGIVTNYNTIPFDTRKPFDPSGIRLGTPAVTSRGMKEAEMKQIARWINNVVENLTNEKLLGKIALEVEEFCKNFPAPGIVIS